MTVILMSIVIISCQKEKKLSCDPNIDNWAKENLSIYEVSDRIDFISLPFYRQKAVYVGLSGESKIRIWKGKLDNVKQQGILSNSELKEYSRLINSLKPYHFDTEKGKSELKAMTERWIAKMQKEYSWDEYHVYEYLESWMTEEERTKSFFLESIVHTRGHDLDTGLIDTIPIDTAHIDTSEIAPPCECRTDIYCKQKRYEECYSDNKKFKCTEVEGCGLWGNDPCTGICINQPW